MNRVEQEKKYWDKAALDPNVDKKYIADVSNEQCLKALGKMKGDVLEIGCGVGRLMKKGYSGIDISKNMIKIAKKRKPNCSFAVNDGRTIPYTNNFFDSVYCMLVFQHIPLDGVINYFDEVARVLKLNGIFRFQFIEGKEKEPFSYHHDLKKIIDALYKARLIPQKTTRGLVHHQWTWIKASYESV